MTALLVLAIPAALLAVPALMRGHATADAILRAERARHDNLRSRNVWE